MADAARSRDGKAWWWRALPFGIFIAFMAAEPWLAGVVEPWLDARWLYGIRSGAAALVMLALWRHYVELRPEEGAGARGWALGALVGVTVFVLWVLLDFPPLVMPESFAGEFEPFDPTADGRLHLGLALTRLAGAALVVPVIEELFWRSFLMRWIEKPRFLAVDPRTVGPKALVVSSAIFAVEHHLWFAGLLAGLAYGELYRRTADLRAVTLAHAVTNGLLGFYVLATGSWHFW